MHKADSLSKELENINQAMRECDKQKDIVRSFLNDLCQHEDQIKKRLLEYSHRSIEVERLEAQLEIVEQLKRDWFPVFDGLQRSMIYYLEKRDEVCKKYQSELRSLFQGR